MLGPSAHTARRVLGGLPAAGARLPAHAPSSMHHPACLQTEPYTACCTADLSKQCILLGHHLGPSGTARRRLHAAACTL